jgi:hypothetical protein
VELVFFEAQGRADFGQIDDEGRVLPCTEEKAGSLTVWSRICRRRRGYGSQAFLGKFGMCKAKSANIELCVICRSSLKSKI